MTGRRVSGRTKVVPSVPGTKPNMKTTGTVSERRSQSSSSRSRKPSGARKVARPVKKVVAVEVEDSEAEKEYQRTATLDQYTKMVRERCVLTERWMVYDPQYDPSRSQRASLVMEMDKTVEGELRIKRCVKIFDDRSYQVLVDNIDMTKEYELPNEESRLETTHDSDKLMHSIMTKKVCQGLRTFDPDNPVFLQANLMIKQRGLLWYSQECTVVVQKAFMGNSCNPCMKVRNQIRRCLQNDSRKKSRPAMKQVKSSFGKALYSLLNDFSGRGPIPPSQFLRENMLYDEKLGIFISFELHQRIFIASTMPPPPMPLSRNRNRKNRRGSSRSRYPPPTSTITSEYPIQQFITEDGQICYVTMDPMNMGMEYGMPMMVEKFEPQELGEYVTVNEHGNIIIQNIQGQDFALAEGQEYELIGEAPSNTLIEPIELLPADNQQIQIIEVDDATMEQIEVHNSTENMQIANVDPNDPNLSHLFRAFQSQIQGLVL